MMTLSSRLRVSLPPNPREKSCLRNIPNGRFVIIRSGILSILEMKFFFCPFSIRQESPMTDDHKFQVNLRGVIDLLSHHLYSGPQVYVRELMQNAVDAIAARRHAQPDHQGEIRLEVVPGNETQRQPTLGSL